MAWSEPCANLDSGGVERRLVVNGAGRSQQNHVAVARDGEGLDPAADQGPVACNLRIPLVVQVASRIQQNHVAVACDGEGLHPTAELRSVAGHLRVCLVE